MSDFSRIGRTKYNTVLDIASISVYIASILEKKKHVWKKSSFKVKDKFLLVLWHIKRHPLYVFVVCVRFDVRR